MGMIPLVELGPSPSITREVDKFSLDGNIALIIGADPNLYQSSPAEGQLTYDLRVGQHYRDHRDLGAHSLPDGKEITTGAGAAYLIETEEEVRLPKTMFGLILPKVSLLQRGLSSPATKIDPGYSGRLVITLFNHGKRKVRLSRRAPLCSLQFVSFGFGAKAYGGKGKQIDAGERVGILARFRDFVDANNATITILVSLAVLILMALQVIPFYWAIKRG